jgi:hypothetical protein
MKDVSPLRGLGQKIFCPYISQALLNLRLIQWLLEKIVDKIEDSVKIYPRYAGAVRLKLEG